MFSAHGGGGCGLSAADALKEAADSAATGPDYKDDDTPPSVVVDSKALWSLSCGSSALQPPATLRPSVARQRRGTKEIEAAPVLLRTIASTKEGGSPGSLLRRAVSGSASANASGSGSPVNLRPPSPTSPTMRALRQPVPPPGAVFANLPEVERRPDEARPRPRPRPRPFAARGRTSLASAAICPPSSVTPIFTPISPRDVTTTPRPTQPALPTHAALAPTLTLTHHRRLVAISTAGIWSRGGSCSTLASGLAGQRTAAEQEAAEDVAAAEAAEAEAAEAAEAEAEEAEEARGSASPVPSSSATRPSARLETQPTHAVRMAAAPEEAAAGRSNRPRGVTCSGWPDAS